MANLKVTLVKSTIGALKDQQAPVKLAGAPAGSSLTVMFTRGVCNLRRKL